MVKEKPIEEVVEEKKVEGKQTDKIIAWCCKCKKKTEMKDIKISKSKKGVEMRKGLCSICDCKMCRFGGLK